MKLNPLMLLIYMAKYQKIKYNLTRKPVTQPQLCNYSWGNYIPSHYPTAPSRDVWRRRAEHHITPGYSQDDIKGCELHRS